MFSGIENPEDSGNFNQTLIPFTCASDSPIPCTFVNGTTVPSLGYVLSFGEDNNNDIYLLASSGVYRIVSPSRCNYACSKEVVTPPSPSPTTSTPSQTSRLSLPKNAMLLCSSLLLILLGFIQHAAKNPQNKRTFSPSFFLSSRCSSSCCVSSFFVDHFFLCFELYRRCIIAVRFVFMKEICNFLGTSC